MNISVKLKKLDERAVTPVYSTEFSAGADLRALTDEPITIAPGESKLIHTGISVAMPSGVVGLVFARSGLATKQGLAPANKVGVIDADYRGEIMVCLYNHSKETRTVENGDRIAQIAFMPHFCASFEECQDLPESVRGVGGFGSTGVK